MQATEVFSIDGEIFDIGVVSVKREAPFLDKFAKRTDDGILKRELIGVYFNYTMSFPKSKNLNMSEYARLYDKVTEPVDFHTVVVPGTLGQFTYEAYITGVTDELLRIDKEGNNYWGNLQVKFIAQSPSRS